MKKIVKINSRKIVKGISIYLHSPNTILMFVPVFNLFGPFSHTYNFLDSTLLGSLLVPSFGLNHDLFALLRFCLWPGQTVCLAFVSHRITVVRGNIWCCRKPSIASHSLSFLYYNFLFHYGQLRRFSSFMIFTTTLKKQTVVNRSRCEGPFNN